MAFHSMAMFTFAISQEWKSMCFWFLLQQTILQWISFYKYLSVHEYSWRKIPRKRIAANVFTILILSNCPLQCLHWCCPRSLLSEGGTTGMRVNELTMPFVILLLSNKALLVLFWGSLVVDSMEDENPVVLFPEGTSARIQAYFWQLGDTLPAFPGDSWLPSTMTYLWLNI